MSDSERRAVICGLGAAMVLPATAHAQPAGEAIPVFGPRSGSRALPVPAMADQEGRTRNLADLAGPNGTVLMFYRSAGWCPYCQAQLIAMQQGLGEIERRGYRLVGVSYEGPEVNKAFALRRGITYPLLSDVDAKTIAAWGLRDPQYPQGHRAFGVPRPVIYVIDRQNMIRARLAEETYQNRPPVAVLVRTIDALR